MKKPLVASFSVKSNISTEFAEVIFLSLSLPKMVVDGIVLEMIKVYHPDGIGEILVPLLSMAISCRLQWG